MVLRRRIREACRQVVDDRLFGLSIFTLILVSIALLGVELTGPPDSPVAHAAASLQHAITWIFVGELTVRYLAMQRFGRFVREHWIDILAVFPLLRVFRLGRAFMLLRLLRLLSLPTLMSRHLRVLGFLINRRLAEYLLYMVLFTFVIVFGTVGLTMFESPHDGRHGLDHFFWTALFSLFAGEYITQFPVTLGGKLTTLVVLFSGLGFFAIMTGTVSAMMIEKLKEGTVASHMSLEDLDGHVIVCGWNSGVETLLRELQSHPDYRTCDVVVIAEREDLPEVAGLPAPGRVRHVREDFTRADVLRRVNIASAEVAIIVSDVSQGRTRQDADARTVLAALTIEKLNPKVYTCAELSNPMNEPHLRMGKVDQVIITREIAGNLLAQAALHSASVAVLKDLIAPNTGCALVPHAVQAELVGKTFEEALTPASRLFGHIPVGVETPDGRVLVNPIGHVLAAEDRLVCVCRLDGE